MGGTTESSRSTATSSGTGGFARFARFGRAAETPFNLVFEVRR
jgi:hypothetical protein